MIDRVKNTASLLQDGAAIDRAIVASHRRVVLKHRQMNIPLAVWRQGRVMELAPESVPLPDADQLGDSIDR